MLSAELATNSIENRKKVLVCITIQENSKRLIKKGYEIAKENNGELHILHIAKGESIFTEPKNGSLLDDLFKYASELGAEVHVECSTDVTKCIASFIKNHDMTYLVVGESLRNSLHKFLLKDIEKTLESQIPNTKMVVLKRGQDNNPNTNKIATT
ncbi:MAG: universal stress protein [Epulopiscium sp.]|nr:universal stress protein [Candidatus Epulonipiscium sp.]